MTVEPVEAAAPERVLVFGSPPPGGRDLDLLARPAAAAAIAARLEREGFERHGVAFARFRDCTADVVDLVPAAEWGLESGELRALYDDALPLPGLERLVRPAPHHALLVAARRFVRGDGHLRPALRARVEAALADDPEASARARRRAPAWRSVRALELLEEALREGLHVAARRRADALAEQLGSRRAGWAAVGPRLRPPALVGLEGAAAEAHAAALREALDRLGLPAVRVPRVAAPVVALLRPGRVVVTVGPLPAWPRTLRFRAEEHAAPGRCAEIASAVWRAAR